MPSSTLPPFYRCAKCGDEYPATPDYFRVSRHGNVSSPCKRCIAKKKKEWRENNPDKVKAQKRRSHERNKDSNNARTRRWYEDHADEQRQKKRLRNLDNPEPNRERTKRWYKNNPAKGRLRSSRRRNRMLENGGNYTESDLLDLYTRQEERCAYCGITLHNTYHIDHVTPISLGGTSDPSNLALACSDCNWSKQARPLDEWVRVRGW